MKIKQIFSITAGCMCLAALPVSALDGVSVTYGHEDETDLVRAGLQWEWKKTWFASDSWRLGGYWDLSLGYWQMHGSAASNPDIADLGITPVFRLRRNVETGFAPYVEGAIGIHLLSHTYAGKLGSSFEFGDHVGIGARFGSRQEYDVAYVFQHISNGGIKKPNHGINFNQIRFAYFF